MATDETESIACDFKVTPGQTIDNAPTHAPSSIVIAHIIKSNVSFL